MQDEHPFQASSQAAGGVSNAAGDATTKREWTEFERDLETLGRQLAELRTHGAALSEHVVTALEARCREVKRRADAWKLATEQQIEEIQKSAWRQASQAQGAYSEVGARSKETARQMWERAEPLRQGARDVGEGLVRAWSELRTSFGKAAGRLQSEAPESSEEHRKTP
jgi:hypothetical protein